MADRRLFTVRNIEARPATVEAHEVFEYDVQTDVDLDRTLSLGPFQLVRWDSDSVPPGVQRSMILRFSYHLETTPVRSSRQGFHSGGGIPEEFCVLISALARRRIRLGPMVRLGNEPMRVANLAASPHRALVEGTISADELHARLESLRSLPERHHQAFILACRMYQQALDLVDAKPDLAYLLLVSCIEVFVATLPGVTEADLEEDVRAALASCPDEHRAVLLARFLDLERGITKKFVSFIESHVSDSFWKGSQGPLPNQVRKDELASLLRKVYSQRSDTLHKAVPFPPNILYPPSDCSEIDRDVKVVDGERSLGAAIPHVSFFERLVHHVLTTFLEKNAVSSSAQSANASS